MLTRRIRSAAILIATVAAAVYAGGLWFFALVAVAASLASYEFVRMMKRGGYRPFWPLSLALIWLLLADARYPTWGLLRPTLLGAVILSLIWQLFQKDTPTPVADWALTLAGALYIGGLASRFIALRDGPQGIGWMALVLLPTWLGDTAAYFVGLSWGRRKIAPRLSPGKTWEGTISGWVVELATTAIVGRFVGLSLGQGLLLGALVATAIPFGDLAVSMMKRRVGVKDTSSLIPGHGGMLDRLDSLLFAVAVVYYYARYAVGAR